MAIHPQITSSSSPFSTGNLRFYQFLFLWALDRLENGAEEHEMDYRGVGAQMERIVNGQRTFGLNTIHQLSDEMQELGFTNEKDFVHNGKIIRSYQLTPQGHKKLGEIYEANQSKGLEPYKELELKHYCGRQ